MGSQYYDFISIAICFAANIMVPVDLFNGLLININDSLIIPCHNMAMHVVK